MSKYNELLDEAVKFAKLVAVFVPGAQAGIEIGEKAIELVETLISKAPADSDPTELRAIRRELRAAVSAKAQATADRLDG